MTLQLVWYLDYTLQYLINIIGGATAIQLHNILVASSWLGDQGPVHGSTVVRRLVLYLTMHLVSGIDIDVQWLKYTINTILHKWIIAGYNVYKYHATCYILIPIHNTYGSSF